LISFCLLAPLQATTLKIATIVPDGTTWMKQLRAAAKQVDQGTDGRLKIRYYPGGVMGSDQSVLRKIRVGQLHGGAITGGGLMRLYPDAELYSLPFLFRDLGEVDHVRQVMDEKFIAGLKAKGFISYGISEGGFAYLMSNRPVRRTEDLHGLKIWIPEGDQTNARAFNTLGITPIPLPVTDVLTGLQTGLIDTVATSPIGAIALQWHTRVKYLTQVPLAYLYASLIIKESALKRVSAADRAVLRQAMQDAFTRLNRQNRKDEKGALAALAQEGITFIKPSPQELAGWERHAAHTIAEMDDGRRFSHALLKQIEGLIQDYRTQPHP